MFGYMLVTGILLIACGFIIATFFKKDLMAGILILLGVVVLCVGLAGSIITDINEHRQREAEVNKTCQSFGYTGGDEVYDQKIGSKRSGNKTIFCYDKNDIYVSEAVSSK